MTDHLPGEILEFLRACLVLIFGLAIGILIEKHNGLSLLKKRGAEVDVMIKELKRERSLNDLLRTAMEGSRDRINKHDQAFGEVLKDMKTIEKRLVALEKRRK